MMSGLDYLLQKHVGFYLENDELRKGKVITGHVNNKFTVKFDDGALELINLEERSREWTYLYTPEEMIKSMLQDIYKYTENKINGYSAVYQFDKLQIDYNYGVVTVKFATIEFELYPKVLDAIDNTLEDIFSVDGVVDFKNNLTMNHEYCTLQFVIPEGQIEWRMYIEG